VKDVSLQVRQEALANDSDHGKVRFDHVVECFDLTWNKAKEGRYGLIRREAWVPHQGGSSSRDDCPHVLEITNCTSYSIDGTDDSTDEHSDLEMYSHMFPLLLLRDS